MGGQHDLNFGCRIDDTHHIGNLIRIDLIRKSLRVFHNFSLYILLKP